MKVLIAVKGSEPDSYLHRAISAIRPQEGDEILLAHILDSATRADFERSRERFLVRKPVPTHRQSDIGRAEKDRAAAIVEGARASLVSVRVGPDAIREIIGSGEPRPEILRIVVDERIDVLVGGGRSGKVGPASIGKTARFLIDHSPCSTLLIR